MSDADKQPPSAATSAAVDFPASLLIELSVENFDTAMFVCMSRVGIVGQMKMPRAVAAVMDDSIASRSMSVPYKDIRDLSMFTSEGRFYIQICGGPVDDAVLMLNLCFLSYDDCLDVYKLLNDNYREYLFDKSVRREMHEDWHRPPAPASTPSPPAAPEENKK